MIYIFYIFAHRGKESEKRAKKERKKSEKSTAEQRTHIA